MRVLTRLGNSVEDVTVPLRLHVISGIGVPSTLHVISVLWFIQDMISLSCPSIISGLSERCPLASNSEVGKVFLKLLENKGHHEITPPNNHPQKLTRALSPLPFNRPPSAWQQMNRR